jgi:hypothetical protein
VSIGHSGLMAPGWRSYGDDSTLRPNYLINSLFPFTSSYVVYSGNCPGANPSVYGVTSGHFAPPMGGLTPGATTSITVREPALRLQLGTSDFPPDTRVRISWAANLLAARGGGPTYCAGTKTYRTDPNGWVHVEGTTPPDAPGDPGIPYGTYDICVDYNGTQLTKSGIEVADPDGVTVAMPTSSTVIGPCP